MWRVLSVCLVLALSIQPLPAESDESETDEPAQEQSSFFGGARVGYLEVQHVDTGSLNVGFMFGYTFTPVFALEGSIDYHTAEFDLAGRETYAFQASAYLYPFDKLKHIQPYAVGGVGYYLSRYEFEPFLNLDNEKVGDGGFHAGFGIDIPVTEELAGSDDWRITIDVRYLFTQESESADIESDGFLLSVGFKVYL